mmetsp:Transcript_70949/g.125436  ORF Transcript_70949/g.125436 Transcript_70949/m.125436 type:complete len:505 (+) Transcript_70949:62-1576(+)
MAEMSKLTKSLDSFGATSQLVAAGSVLCIGMAALRQYLLSYKLPNGCPEAPGTLGALPRIWRAVRKSAIHDELVEAHEEMGDTVFLSFGLLRYFLRPIVVTRDARNVEYMLKNNFPNYPKGDVPYAVLHDLLGDGIFNADGASWMAQRKTASQMFTANRFKNHIWRVVEKNIGKVLNILEVPNGAIDIFNLMNRFTLDSIGEIGFGTSIGSLEHPESPFLKSFDEAQRISFRRFIFPGWRLLRLLGLGFEKDSGLHFRALKKYSADLVQDLRGKLDSEAGDSFLGLFMKSRASGLPGSKDFLIDMVLNFLIAGRDTTAQAMSWCFFLITQHPTVEAKILEEIQDICGDGLLQYDQLNRFKYLEAVLNETLRLYPSVPVDLKVAEGNDTLPDGTYISKGTMFCYAAYAMGRSEQIWGKDAGEFRPERWLALQAPKSPYENPSFHAGPRECLGKRLAMVEMKTVLISVLRNFHLELDMDAEDVLQDVQMTIGMSSGLRCRATPRLS